MSFCPLYTSPQEAAERARDILGLDISGHTVETVMVAEGADILSLIHI